MIKQVKCLTLECKNPSIGYYCQECNSPQHVPTPCISIDGDGDMCLTGPDTCTPVFYINNKGASITFTEGCDEHYQADMSKAEAIASLQAMIDFINK